MILSDITIRRMMNNKRIVVKPEPQDWQLQPASIDLTLGNEFRDPYSNKRAVFEDNYTILPGECVLATTAEWVEVSAEMAARVEGKSSWGRRFILTHATAGFVDPGFKGMITLELVNLSKVSQVLPIGGAIAQISFFWCDKEVTRPYGSPGLNSHYQGQVGATESASAWL